MFQVWFYGCLVFGVDLGLIVWILSNPIKFWPVGFALFFALLGTRHLIKTDFFSPILVCEDKIKFKGQEYGWEAIRITAYPEGQRSFCYAYVLYFGKQYYYTDESIKKNKKICQVYLNEKNLEMILPYYNKKIFIVDRYHIGQMGEIRAPKKIKQKIETHNRRIKNNTM